MFQVGTAGKEEEENQTSAIRNDPKPVYSSLHIQMTLFFESF
jgi:hypothetical protein